jgi:hypothetical protein
MVFLGGHYDITCHLGLLTKNEAPVVLKFSGERFISWQKNGAVLQDEGKHIRKATSKQNNNETIPNKSNAVY